MQDQEQTTPPQAHVASSGAEDLEPTAPDSAHRTWTWAVFARAWASMVMNPGSLSCGAAMLSLGLSVPMAMLAQFVASVILVIALILNGWAGTRYGVPFPVLARSAFGNGGAHVCTLSRGAVAIMWLSFQIWQATLGVFVALQRFFGIESEEHQGLAKGLLFAAFLFLHAVLVHLGLARFKGLVKYTLPALALGLLGMMIWASRIADFAEAIDEIHAAPDTFQGSSPVLAFLTAVNSSIAVWSTLVLNVCDLSRFSPRQTDQGIGQALGLPLPFLITGFAGMWIAGATKVAFGVSAWQVPELFAYWSPAVSLLASVVLAISIIVVNVLANILSPINDLMNLAPQRLGFRFCGYVALALSAAVCPWWMFSSQNRFVLTFLNGYGMVTGALAGVLLSDYWILRRQQLDMKELYSDSANIKWRALFATLLGIAPGIPGFVSTFVAKDGFAIPFWEHLYHCGSWIIALAISGSAHVLLHWLHSLMTGTAFRQQESDKQKLDAPESSA